MLDAEQLKQQLGARAKDIIFNGTRMKSKGRNVYCPLHNDKNPSMSWFNEGLMWRCHACGGTIDIYRYYTDFENLSFVDAKRKVAELTGNSFIEESNKAKAKEYKKPKIQTSELTQEYIDYMQKRKITSETLTSWKVKAGTFKGEKSYVFQYFDEKNELQFVSYRHLVKGGLKGGCEPETKPILWGMWHCNHEEPLIITEGQPDAMIVYQCGFKNVVSIPAGANNLTWITNCWDWLKKFHKIIFFADNDTAGRECAEQIKTRLVQSIVVMSDLGKDANEIYYKYGEKPIIDMITEAIALMPSGLIDMSDSEYRTLDKSIGNGIETGIIEYDEHVEDWKEEELTIIFGRNGEGKTTFISQIIAHNLQRKVKTFLYSGELSENKIQNWLYRQLLGNKTEHLKPIKTKYKTKWDIKPEIVKVIKEWHKETIYLFDRSEKEVLKNEDKFFELLELSAKRYGVKLFIIDNLMSYLEENADSLYSDQANFVQRCKDFAVRNKVHFVLLCHPNKLKDELTSNGTPNLAKTDISGSNNIANKADNIIAVERNWADNPEFDAIITSLKDREEGSRKSFHFKFSKSTLRFYSDKTTQSVNYGWEDLIPKPKEYVQNKIYDEPLPW